MSFKRDGDDPGQLGALQRRRVAELLASFIPEEEAVLLRSGRYACAVCPHRPVFDTLEVLSVHREGRKHRSSEWGLGGGLNEHGPRSRQRLGSPAPLLARTRRIAQSALLKAAPYNSCCRRTGPPGSDACPAAATPQEQSSLCHGAAQSPEPRAAPGHGAVPAAAQVSPGPTDPGAGTRSCSHCVRPQLRMDPGLLRQVGEG
uniref:Uncharacterized protein n=1 Tax=Melopsittacus undulatus TaxID=13146 RepID=A0A8V5GPV9_MELUD